MSLQVNACAASERRSVVMFRRSRTNCGYRWRSERLLRPNRLAVDQRLEFEENAERIAAAMKIAVDNGHQVKRSMQEAVPYQ